MIPSPTPKTVDIFQSMAGREAYSFTDGFLGYHQVGIAEGDGPETTSTTGSFIYNAMPGALLSNKYSGVLQNHGQ